jgi:predicted transcriptional regulator
MKEQATEIVAAYLRRNKVATSDIPAVIAQVYEVLTGLGPVSSAEPDGAPLKPAVPIRRSVHADFPASYAVVTAKYAARRSELAKAAGLGKRKQAATGSAVGYET